VGLAEGVKEMIRRITRNNSIGFGTTTSLNRLAYRVTMKSGKLTRSKWVKNKVTPQQVVRDYDGRVFRIKDVIEVESPAMKMVVLKGLR
jgi:hypothetical protein